MLNYLDKWNKTFIYRSDNKQNTTSRWYRWTFVMNYSYTNNNISTWNVRTSMNLLESLYTFYSYIPTVLVCIPVLYLRTYWYKPQTRENRTNSNDRTKTNESERNGTKRTNKRTNEQNKWTRTIERTKQIEKYYELLVVFFLKLATTIRLLRQLREQERKGRTKKNKTRRINIIYYFYESYYNTHETVFRIWYGVADQKLACHRFVLVVIQY